MMGGVNESSNKPASPRKKSARASATSRAARTSTSTRAKAPPKKAAKKASSTAGPSKRSASSSRRPAQRADLGAPIDGFFAKQPPALRAILEALRKLVESTVPDAQSAIKWGMPFYTLHGQMMVALGAHKSHVNLILAGPPAAFHDPEGRLTGSAKGGRHLKLTALDQLPQNAARTWIKAAAAHARSAR